MKPKGVFITFEGVEGSGKTTQMARIGRWLRGRGHQVELTREPDGTTEFKISAPGRCGSQAKRTIGRRSRSAISNTVSPEGAASPWIMRRLVS